MACYSPTSVMYLLVLKEFVKKKINRLFAIITNDVRLEHRLVISILIEIGSWRKSYKICLNPQDSKKVTLAYLPTEYYARYNKFSVSSWQRCSYNTLLQYTHSNKEVLLLTCLHFVRVFHLTFKRLVKKRSFFLAFIELFSFFSSDVCSIYRYSLVGILIFCFVLSTQKTKKNSISLSLKLFMYLMHCTLAK